MAKFTKEQIIQSKKYRQWRDSLAVALSENKRYTHDEIKQALDEFLTRPVVNRKNKKGA